MTIRNHHKYLYCKSKQYETKRRYGDEESCKLKLDQQGVICKKCGGNEYYWHKTRWQMNIKNVDFARHSVAEP